MRTAAAFLIAALPVIGLAQERKAEGPSTATTEITGCVRGSVLTDIGTRRWRLRGPRAVMNELKKHDRKQVRIVGTSKEAASGYGGRRVGKTNIYIGGSTNTTGRDPLPEQPTIDVQSFELTGETCR